MSRAVRVLPLALLLAACSAPEPTPCDVAQAHVDECLDGFCAQSPDAPLCRARAGAAAAGQQALCEGTRADQAGQVTTASCADIVAAAAAAAGGKADADCPWYFPWCAAVAPAGAGYSVHVLAADATSLTLRVDVERLERGLVTIDGAAHDVFSIQGAGSPADLGRPDVPVIGLLLGVPWDATAVQVEPATGVRTEVIEGAVPVPFRARARDDEVPPPYVKDTASYADYSEYPAELASLGAPAVWRDYRVVRLEVRPVRSVTALRQVIVDRGVVVTLRFARQGSGLDDPTSPGTGEPMDDAYASALANFETAAPRDGGRDEPRFDYLVIADDALVDALAPLLAAKEAAGLDIQVITLSEIGDPVTPETIKAKIQAAYQAGHHKYLLLAGAPEKIPLYHYREGWDDYPSDLYYGLLEGDDLLADVAIGRLAAQTPEEMTVLVNKTLAYMSGDARAEWRNKMVLVAHEEMYPKKYTECVKSIIDRDYGRPIDWVAILGGEGGKNQMVTDAINAGAGIVSYRGHGDDGEWCDWAGDGPYVASQQDLHNGDMTPVVFSIACLTANIEKKDTLAEQFTLREGGGAVAFLGATQPSWTIPNHDYNRYLFRALLDRNVHRIGVLTNEANAALLRQYGGEKSAAENAKMYLWLGDPALQVGVGYHCDALAAAEAGEDVAVVAGDTATLGTEARAGWSYAWEPADGLSCTDCAQPTVTGAATTTYTLTVRTGCSVASDTVTVTVADAPLPPDAAPEAADAAPLPPDADAGPLADAAPEPSVDAE